MRFNNILAAVAALAGTAAAIACQVVDSGASLVVPVPPLTVDSTNGFCLCASGSKVNSSDVCAEYVPTPVTGCTVASPIDVQSLNKMTEVLTGVDMDGGTDKVPFTFQLQHFHNRAFTEVGLAAYNEENSRTLCKAVDKFLEFALTTGNGAAGTPCYDEWQFKVHFKDLIACGFAEDIDPFVSSADARSDPLYTVYVGNIILKYKEKIMIGGSTSDAAYQTPADRTVTTIFPVAIKLRNTFTAALTVSDVKVYTNYDVADWAIVGQYIPKGGASAPKPTVHFKYTIQYPYDVSEYHAIALVTADGIPVDATTPITSSSAPSTAITVPAHPCGVDSYPTSNGIRTCQGGGTDGDVIVFNPSRDSPAQCRFNNYQYKLDYYVHCYAALISSTDCPLEAADTTNTVTFKLLSETFCIDQTAADVINGVITITTFDAVDYSDHLTPQNAWLWGNSIFFRMRFDGLNMHTVTLVGLESAYSADNGALAADAAYTNSWLTPELLTGATGLGLIQSGPGTIVGTAPGVQADTLDPFFTTTGTGNTGLGFKETKIGNPVKQEFYFQLTMGETLTGSVAPARGKYRMFRLRATIKVTYNTSYSRRRRRQAADVTGTGTKESEIQTIYAPPEAAMAPNSAVRAAPAVAFVLALLSAVALL